MLREKITQIMYNKYGNDNLNITLLGSALVLAFLNLFFGLKLIYMLQTVCLILFFIRFFSSNHQARMNENEKFLNFVSKFKKRNSSNSYNTVYTNETKVEYKYFKCKSCGAKLRVPKKKGKITITCPKCRTSFKGKS